MFDQDAPDSEDRLERLSRDNGIDLFPEDGNGYALNVQIYVIRITGASEEKPQVAAPFQGPFFLIQFPADVADQKQMEDLYGLPWT
jgi:hypothetical protein